MKVSWDHYSQYDGKNHPNVPNHQPNSPIYGLLILLYTKKIVIYYIYIYFIVYNIISHQVLASPWLRHAPRRQRQDAVHQIPGSSDLETNHHGRGQGIPGGRIPESQREPLAIGVVSQFLDKPSIYWA